MLLARMPAPLIRLQGNRWAITTAKVNETRVELRMSQRPKALSKLLEETHRVILTEWRLAPGAETGWHRHAHDYVVVCLTAGKASCGDANGKCRDPAKVRSIVRMPAGHRAQHRQCGCRGVCFRRGRTQMTESIRVGEVPRSRTVMPPNYA